jgi:hypothetical protein
MMSEATKNIEQPDRLAVVEEFANKLNAEDAALRAHLQQASAAQPITVDEQRRRHGDEILSVLLGPNTGAATGLEQR